METSLHIVLSGKIVSGGITTQTSRNVRLQKTIPLVISPENLDSLIKGRITIGKRLKDCPTYTVRSGSVKVGKPPISYSVHLIGYNPNTNTLEGEIQANRPICNGYGKELTEDGWEEIP